MGRRKEKIVKEIAERLGIEEVRVKTALDQCYGFQDLAEEFMRCPFVADKMLIVETAYRRKEYERDKNKT